MKESTGNHYLCSDCNHRWQHEDDRCPECGSENTETEFVGLSNPSIEQQNINDIDVVKMADEWLASEAPVLHQYYHDRIVNLLSKFAQFYHKQKMGRELKPLKDKCTHEIEKAAKTDDYSRLNVMTEFLQQQ